MTGQFSMLVGPDNWQRRCLGAAFLALPLTAQMPVKFPFGVLVGKSELVDQFIADCEAVGAMLPVRDL